MGEWVRSERAGAVAVAMAAGVPAEAAKAAVMALADSGLIVVGSHYVPTDRELYGQYASLSNAWFQFANGRGEVARWVMCLETFTAIEKRARGLVAPVYTDPIRLQTRTEERMRATVETVPVVMATHVDQFGRVIAGKLFGLDIRIDPVARRPMFELVEKS